MISTNGSFAVNLKISIASIYLLNSISLAIGNIQNTDPSVIDPAVALTTDPQLKNYFIKMEDFGDELQRSESPKTSIFGLKAQRLEIGVKENLRIHSLEKGQIEISKPAFTLLKYSANNDAKEFIIEAISGADEKGENGKIVAKHILTGYDVATVVADNLLVVIVERNGNISVIPKSMIIHYGFEAPIPVFNKINGSSLKFENPSNIKGEFLTIGSKPLKPQETTLQVSAGKEYEAGQLALWEESEKGERINLQLLPMTSVLEFVNLGLRYLNAASQLVSLDQQNVKELEAILKEIHEGKEDSNFQKIQSQLSAEESEILSKYTPDKIKKTLSTASQLKASSQSAKDKFTLEEWEKEYSEVQNNAEIKYQESLKQAKLEQEKNKTLSRKIFSFLKKNQVVDPEDYKPDAKNYQKYLSQNSTALQFHKSKVQIFKENLSKVLKSKTVTYLMIGSPILAFYSLPYFYDKSESLKQVESLSYMYENIIPDVLKDQAYRTPLIISTVIQIALIPLVYLSAWAFKTTILALSYTYKDSNTRFGLKVKDFAARYRELTTTQVLLTLNVRFFSMMSLSPNK